MKFDAIEAEKAKYPVALMCRMLEVSRAGYYASRNADRIAGKGSKSIEKSCGERASC